MIGRVARCRGSIGALQGISKKPGFGICFGGGGVIFRVYSNSRIAEKLRRIILLHFGLVIFRFQYGRSRRVFIFMILGPGGRDHGPPWPPETIILDFVPTKLLQIIQEKCVLVENMIS